MSKDTKVQRYKGIGTASNFPVTSPKRCEDPATPRRQTRPKKVLFPGNKTQREILHTNVSRSLASNSQKHSQERCDDPATQRGKTRLRKVLFSGNKTQRETRLTKASRSTPPSPSISKRTNYLNKEIILSTQGETKAEF